MEAQEPAGDAPAAARHLVVMGVSGCGKTTVTDRLAATLNFASEEADTFHPQANIDKMTAGTALTDEDRWPWLRAIRDWITESHQAGRSTVVSCSALRRAYRDLLREAEGLVEFVHLHGSMELIESRLAGRSGHFMPPSLLASQFATLEPLEEDEAGVRLDIADPPDQLVTQAIERLQLSTESPTQES